MPVIRAEQPADTDAIHRVHAACFPTHAEAELVAALRRAGHLSVSLVAVLGADIVGHVAFSPVSVEDGRRGMGLGPVAVLPAHRRHGVAARLVRDGLERCRALDAGWAVVLGSPAYYARFGFRAAAEAGLSDEYGGGASFQALELVGGALPRQGGLVRYAPAFSLVA